MNPGIVAAELHRYIDVLEAERDLYKKALEEIAKCICAENYESELSVVQIAQAALAQMEKP